MFRIKSALLLDMTSAGGGVRVEGKVEGRVEGRGGTFLHAEKFHHNQTGHRGSELMCSGTPPGWLKQYGN